MIRCDDRQLEMLLDADEYSDASGEMAAHVESCTHCQARLASLVASPAEWRDARRWLSGDPGSPHERVAGMGRRGGGQGSHSVWSEAIVRQLLDPPSHPEMLGRLGRYEIERLIGSGGMGIVFKAYDTELNRSVAIKLLGPHLAGSEAARRRFAREARAAAGIVDDHVVPIHNVATDHDPPYLVMQYVAGGSIQEKLDRHGPLEITEIVRIGVQTAKGLSAAHAQGLIHRDVKPSNILLDEGVERALLTDFGLARMEDDACLTRTGFQPGTPHYMSPEQVRGEAIDGRSDLFSLGCVLYALCTGRPPFHAESGYAVLRRITDDPPRAVREINPEVPEWLERIVMRLLEKDRGKRFESAKDVTEALGQWLRHLQQPSVIPPPAAIAPAKSSGAGRNRRVVQYLMGAAASLLLLLAGILVVLETSKGTIRIESDVDDVPIRIFQGDKVVDTLTVSKSGTGVRVYSGKYVVQVDGEFSGVDIRGGTVTIGRRDQKIVRVVQSHSEDQHASQAAGGQVPAATTAPEDHQYLVWEGADTVRLSHWLARSVQLSDQKRQAVNALLSDTWRKYVTLEERYTEFSRTPNGHLVAKVDVTPVGAGEDDFALDRERLDDEFWTSLDRIVSGRQRELLHALSTRRGDGEGDDTWSARPKAFPSLLGWRDEWYHARVEIWTKGTWFHWEIATRQNSASGDGQSLPPELKHYYVLGQKHLEEASGDHGVAESDAGRSADTINPSDFLKRYGIDGRAYRTAMQELSAAEATLKQLAGANGSEAQAAVGYRLAATDVTNKRLAALWEIDRILRELQIRLDTLDQIKVESFGEDGKQEAERIRIDRVLLEQAIKEMRDARQPVAKGQRAE